MQAKRHDMYVKARKLLRSQKSIDTERSMEDKIAISQYGMLRHLIAKHFLSKSLDEIHNDSCATGTYKLRLLARTQIFCKALDRAFPKRSTDKRNMGEKYY